MLKDVIKYTDRVLKKYTLIFSKYSKTQISR
jgi:hypothetical protein